MRQFRPVILIILTSALLAVVSGCRSGVVLVPESVIVRDTVIVTKERTLTDTLTLFRDTVIYQDRVKVRVDFRDSLVYLKVDCPSDTVRVNVTKYVYKPAEPKKNEFKEVIIWLSVLLLIIFGLLIFVRYRLFG